MVRKINGLLKNKVANRVVSNSLFFLFGFFVMTAIINNAIIHVKGLSRSKKSLPIKNILRLFFYILLNESMHQIVVNDDRNVYRSLCSIPHGLICHRKDAVLRKGWFKTIHWPMQ